uniref:Large ribosomal subunit protein uL18 n=1 Tax=Desulfatirhabdium butyrativorans TaxID=340467 RepID=A0A7C4MMA9_9BACT
MGKTNPKYTARLKRKQRIRKNLTGTTDRPRLCVFRSAKHIYAQIIDDTSGKTMAAASTLEKEIAARLSEVKGKVEKAKIVGKAIAERAKDKGIMRVVFDRNGYLYHGRVKAVSDGARENGLEF